MIGFGLRYISILLTLTSTLLIKPTSAENIQTIVCAFKTETTHKSTGPIYMCDITSEFTLIERHIPITSIASSHPIDSRKNSDLCGFHAIGKSTHYMPDFTPLSKEIVALTLHRCKLLKLNKDDLKPYPKLVYLMLLKNKLRVLEKDVFDHTPELKFLDVGFNMLKEIVPGALDSLVSLGELRLLANECTQKEASDRTGVEKLIAELKDECMVKFRATVVGRKRDEEHRRKRREKTSLWVTFGITFGTCIIAMSVVVGLYFLKKNMLRE